ncbi:hypothetical protein [Actinophytocola sp.]|uniref:hypothetical protein n=1 Tax=Actinophytocola sp. TaxID=1872138 RepID=UPI00389A1EDB
MSQPDGPSAEERDAEDLPETGEPDAAPATRRKVWLFWTAAVVVLVAVGVVVFLLTRDDSTDTASPSVPTIADSNAPSSPSQTPPTTGTTATMSASAVPPTTSAAAPAGEPRTVQSVAEQAATAISNADVKTLAQLSCDPGAAGEQDTFPTNAKVEVIGEPQVSGDTATITVRVTVEGADPAEIPMPLTKQDGRWCIP